MESLPQLHLRSRGIRRNNSEIFRYYYDFGFKDKVEIINAGNGRHITTLTNLPESTTVYEMKKKIHRIRKILYPERQALKVNSRGKSLSDNVTLESIEFKGSKQLYLKDLGPQISWKAVFLLEYAGPLALYMVAYCRPFFLYGGLAQYEGKHFVVHIAAACWVIHYVKRLFETLFVHRFSHSTMPVRNLFKNCSYYWAFGLYVGYYVNHPLYTPPSYGDAQIYYALAGFIFSELGNLSIHVALRNLRPPGSHERKIPVATNNPFTCLFNLVSCPNYTYEVMSWLSFTVMTQCLPAGLFTLAGLYQMTVWAIGKHRNYLKEFANYPKRRKSIIPFLL